ncbi:ABC transporter ATP-binding protein [Acetobacter sp. DsW_063]|uniref:ABC transporter ATP-binding protein n=1 Tax=Acetobacter sp. DsW_063 TaxID=1514894 RepID=UPI000A3A19E1|nr:ABC transporter ATP-binding protein [Acetobacter sp. DsW_063]OUJ12998.1 ABC transporter ATP-binding protein [Acetobacter sp. DsW_063]
MATIEVTDLAISFPLYHGDARSLKKTVRRSLDGKLSGRFTQDRRERVLVQALKGISFSLQRGERLGLIGGNGAGKTTLLRALAGIYEPLEGQVLVKGRVGALLDTSLGMNDDMSGRENIRLRGLFHALGEVAIQEIERDVETFADLGPFLDLPIKTYSSGMRVRLAFGLATAIMPQVLIMDEWFMAGDASFRERAKQRMIGLVEGAEILVVSSHQPEIMQEWCTRLLWMDQGQVRMDGPTDDVLDAYLSTAG